MSQCNIRTPSKADIIAEARTWIGTPFRHQGRIKGVGVDCAGFLIGVGRAVGFPVIDMPTYDYDPDPKVLERVLAQQLIKVPGKANLGKELQLCDILQMKFDRDGGKHLALVTDIGIIHAYARVRKVTEHALDDAMKDRITAVWRFPWLH